MWRTRDKTIWRNQKHRSATEKTHVTSFVPKFGDKLGHSASYGSRHGLSWYPCEMPAWRHSKCWCTYSISRIFHTCKHMVTNKIVIQLNMYLVTFIWPWPHDPDTRPWPRCCDIPWGQGRVSRSWGQGHTSVTKYTFGGGLISSMFEHVNNRSYRQSYQPAKISSGNEPVSEGFRTLSGRRFPDFPATGRHREDQGCSTWHWNRSYCTPQNQQRTSSLSSSTFTRCVAY